ncbi:MAG: PAS domain-containing protein [Christensenella sp.]
MKSNYSNLIGKTISDNIIIRYIEPELSCQYIGKKMLDFFAYDSEEEFYCAVDGKIINFIHPDDINFVTKSINHQLVTFEQYTIEYRIRKKDGSYIWIQDRGKCIEAPDGKVLILCTYYDLLNQERMQISDESRLYEDIVNKSTCGIYVIEHESYKLLYVNNAMRKILANVEIYDYLEKPCYCVLRNRNHPCEECLASQLFNTGEPQEIYFDFLSKYYSVVSHSIEWRGTSAHVIYISDISEGKKTDLNSQKQRKN